MREITPKPEFQHGPAPEHVVHLPEGAVESAADQPDTAAVLEKTWGMQLHPIAYPQLGPRAKNRHAAGYRDDSQDRPRREPAAKSETNGGSHEPSSEEIAKRAYELYVRGGRKDGDDAKHWAQAERELRIVGR